MTETILVVDDDVDIADLVAMNQRFAKAVGGSIWAIDRRRTRT